MKRHNLVAVTTCHYLSPLRSCGCIISNKQLFECFIIIYNPFTILRTGRVSSVQSAVE